MKTILSKESMTLTLIIINLICFMITKYIKEWMKFNKIY